MFVDLNSGELRIMTLETAIYLTATTDAEWVRYDGHAIIERELDLIGRYSYADMMIAIWEDLCLHS